MNDDLSYPIGQFEPPSVFTPELRAQALATIALTPARLRAAVADLDEAQLDTPYRPGGWTVRQVVHHVADSHMNAYIRLKLALTEDNPTIKPYVESAWAKLEDYKSTPIAVSLALLDCVHDRWLRLLRAMPERDFARRYVHPVTGHHSVDHLLAVYNWHGPHHTAHVTRLRERMGW
jgi:uncharacterized damage-inducible protein DinB